MQTFSLSTLAALHAQGDPVGITSVCSAHSIVIEAALREGLHGNGPVLIEATCNQVNHEGGYTGMTPADFRLFVLRIADSVGFDHRRLLLGGDHLGPNPWKNLPAEEALGRAEKMLEAYVQAGFSKIHLDASMGCLGEVEPLSGDLVAERAARLAAVAERAATQSGLRGPVYVIGTEVPVPGGAMEVVENLQVTTAEAARETIASHQRAFAALGLQDAFSRVIGVVVQPGVEFGNENVVVYDSSKARSLSAVLAQEQQVVFEAHSTDYQPQSALNALVQDGFAILKVGPGLTFALRETLYALDHIASVLYARPEQLGLRQAMERLMLAEPHYWDKYYHGDSQALRLQRHFSYSDRIRYYWPSAEAHAAVEALLSTLGERAIPETLISQYLPELYPQVVKGDCAATAHALLLGSVRRVLATYQRACQGT
ncbi:D-tagatose-bisphosphate aldolase, class II, non-catalytic subunit [Pseudomonas sp. NA-150]|uniref:D-tagatose-bisphosphate aldolase, class II, non-catalytic subunit n=1 Tax=Pseudomonas sp. NA-150 TaxID=3367525 RepID=UPI0037C81621